MKNPALQATLMLVIGGLVFGLAFWLDQDQETGPVTPLASEPGAIDVIVKVTPIERRRQEKYEEAKERLAEFREVGEKTEMGTIKVPDVDGKFYHVKDKLVEGKGRYGEPLYGIAKYRRRGFQPIVERKHKSKVKAHRLTPEQEARFWRKATAPRTLGEGVLNDAGTLPKGAITGTDDDKGAPVGGGIQQDG